MTLIFCDHRGVPLATGTRYFGEYSRLRIAGGVGCPFRELNHGLPPQSITNPERHSLSTVELADLCAMRQGRNDALLGNCQTAELRCRSEERRVGKGCRVRLATD